VEWLAEIFRDSAGRFYFKRMSMDKALKVEPQKFIYIFSLKM